MSNSLRKTPSPEGTEGLRILIVDEHRPQFFWSYVAEGLMRRGHRVVLSKILPIDVFAFDVIIKVYLNQTTSDIVNNIAKVPVVASAMGTDVISGAFRAIDYKRVASVLCYNSEHKQLITNHAPLAKVDLIDWFAVNDKLSFADRPAPEIEAGKIKNLVLVSNALHSYPKGLDNLVQMLEDCTTVDLSTCTLHVIGPIIDPYLSFFLQDFCLGQPRPFRPPRASYRTEFHGEIHPNQLDTYIESLRPNFFVMSSQGEMGATTVMESMFKGVKAIVQEHPFIDGVYADAPIYRYATASGLSKALWNAATEQRLSHSSHGLRKYAQERFTLEKFVENVERILREAVVKNANI